MTRITLDDPNATRTLTGPFIEAALTLYDHGLYAVPSGGDDGKRPLVRTRDWRKRPSRGAFETLARAARFTDANIGVLTGPSGVTIIDIDDPDQYPALHDLCGPTPLITRTPSGGLHLWYRSSGERCRNLRTLGYQADVKGVGGFVVVPPSVRPSGRHAGEGYIFLAGDWDALSVLPPLRPDARIALRLDTQTKGTGSIGGRRPSDDPAIRSGRRNNHLFRCLLEIAKATDDHDTLLEEALALNQIQNDPPLSDAEVQRCARSAWGYQQDGRNWVGTRGAVVIAIDLLDRITDPDTLALCLVLLRCHPGAVATGTSFAISVRAMAKAGTVYGLGERRLRAARAHLLEAGILHEVHQGGSGPGDPSLYAFSKSEPDAS